MFPDKLQPPRGAFIESVKCRPAKLRHTTRGVYVMDSSTLHSAVAEKTKAAGANKPHRSEPNSLIQAKR